MKNVKSARQAINVAIIGTGNIGSDLLVKIRRSKILNLSLFTGQNPRSPNIKRAKNLGINTSAKSIQAIQDNPNICDIVFDATSAAAHQIHAPILKKLNKFTIDLTPSHIGQMCVPILNLKSCLKHQNVNMVSCGGQATAPIAHAIKSVHPQIKYIEIVSSIASLSAGIGTRNNIDEYTQTTAQSLKYFARIPKSKSIIILNPADPPIMMHNTIFAQVQKADLKKLKSRINQVVKQIQQYVPGYKLVLGPIFENGRITVMTKVIGLGDYLPQYAGNLDIINCAAVAVAESYAQKSLNH